MKRARNTLHFASTLVREIQGYDYCPAAKWIDTRINSKIEAGVWGWLWIWYSLLTIILASSVFGSIFAFFGAVSDTRYSYIHPVNIKDSRITACTVINATFDSCLHAFLNNEYETSYYPESCALLVEGDGKDAENLLSNLGIDPGSFTPGELIDYAASYIWCLGQPVCDQQAAGAHLYSALTRGCAAHENQTYELVNHEQCEIGDCEVIAPKINR